MFRFSGEKLLDSEMMHLREVAKFTMNKFVPPSVQKKMYVNIHLTKTYEKGWAGHTEYMGNEDGIRKFNVVVVADKIDHRATKCLNKRLREPIKTLIHELIHVKQYANNQMFDYIDGCTKFEGKIYKNSKMGYYEYWDTPWEIEAYGRTEGVYEQFVLTQNQKLKEAKK